MTKCFFCLHHKEPSLKDFDNLEKFLTLRKKIISLEKTGNCPKHQRSLSKVIKYARFLSILPYTSYQK